MKTASILSAAGLVIVLAMPGRASPLFDQTPTNSNGFTITDYRLADDFTLSSPSTITDILFFYEAQYITDLGAVTYAIYTNLAGTPGLTVQSATIPSGSVTRTDQSGLCSRCADATFSIASLTLAPGTYWLELHADTSLTGNNGGMDVDWAAVDDNNTLIARYNASGGTPDIPVNMTGYNQYAFQLIGSTATNAPTVPEPGTLALFAIGLSLALSRAKFILHPKQGLKN